MPFFSVIIPTYNRAALLAATMESVLAQEFSDYEIICVDDGSTDGTLGVLDQYGARVRTLAQARGGPGAARSYGAEHAAGEYLAFLDSDDLWYSWTLATAKRIIDEAHTPSLILGRLLPFRDERDAVQVGWAAPSYTLFSDYLSTAQHAHWHNGSGIVVRKSAFHQVGGFVREFVLAEEHDLVLRLGDAPGCVLLHAPYVGAYRQHAGSAVSDGSRTFLGLQNLIERERRGMYPGGAARCRDRRQILTRHIRPGSLRLLSARRWSEACHLYRRTWLWQLAEGRWKYLAGFPALALCQRLAGLGFARET